MNKEIVIKKEYYESGQLEAEIPYRNGKRHGIQKEFFKSEQLQRETLFRNGKRHGIQKWYYEFGELKAQIEWKSDKIIKQQNFDKNKKPEMEI